MNLLPNPSALCALNVAEDENEHLRDRIFSLRESIENEAQEQDWNLSVIKTRAFRNRRGVVTIQRATLCELDECIRDHSFRQMERDARTALKVGTGGDWI
jgi:hypothetical protein